MAVIPMECSKSKESVAACGGDHYRTRVGQPALMRKTKARSILQQFDLFAPDLHSALGLRVLQCRFGSRARTREAHGAAARLRDVFDAFRGFSNIHTDSSCNASPGDGRCHVPSVPHVAPRDLGLSVDAGGGGRSW